jgi:hypothetical protein
MAKDKNSKALAIVDAPFTALALPQEEVAALVQENLGDEAVGVFDLDRIKIPSGGIKQWAVPTLEGDMEMVKELVGVIVFKKMVRAYWGKSLDEGGAAAPDCKSDNNIFGTGEPGGICKQCPFAQFGSAINKDGSPGKGQACKLMMLVFILGEDGFLPKIVVCPPTSVAPMRKYFVRLTGEAILVSSVITKLELESDKNDAGIQYSKAKPSIVGALSEEAKEKIKAYIENLAAVWEAEGIKDDDYASAEDKLKE